MRFERTSSGKRETYHFINNVIVWVEGVTDIPVFTQLLHDQACTIKSAGGRLECERLAAAKIAKALPYVVIIDADYDLLGRRRAPAGVIRLDRHSVENYFAERGIVERVAVMFAGDNFDGPITDSLFDRAQLDADSLLPELIALEVAHQRENTGIAVLPLMIDRLCTVGDAGFIDRGKVIAVFNAAASKVGQSAYRAALTDVRNYLTTRSIFSIMGGHLIFQLMRNVAFRAIATVRRKPYCEDRAWRSQFAHSMWMAPLPPDHARLKRRIRKAVSTARAMRSR